MHFLLSNCFHCFFGCGQFSALGVDTCDQLLYDKILFNLEDIMYDSENKKSNEA